MVDPMRRSVDPLQVAVDDIRLAQLAVIEAAAPSAVPGYAGRMAAATATGMGVLGDLTRRNPDAAAMIDRLIGLSAVDARLHFLSSIPDGPVLSMMRALALERALFDVESDEVAELSLLMGLFTLLLDGLLDEAPEALGPVTGWLTRVMRDHAWAGGEPAAPEPPPSAVGLHPVAQLLVGVTSELITTVTRQPGWADTDVRAEFTRAGRAAFDAELVSVDLRIADGETDLEAVRRRVVEKSTTCIWAGALLPVCVHGWPDRMRPDDLETLARSVGTYGGWVDDVVDLLSDLRADRWSAALLELDVGARQLLPRTTDPRSRLAVALRTPLLIGRLPRGGLDRLETVRGHLRRLSVDEDALLPALLDMSRACLADGLAVAAA